MIAVDTNVLVYAHRSESPWHEKARGVLVELAEGWEPWAIPWQCLIEFLGLVTHPRIFDPPTPLANAIDQVCFWADSPSLVLLSEPQGFLSTLATTMLDGRVEGPRVHDARIAALCIHHGVTTLYTADRDFSRFERLHTRNPLIGAE